MYFPEPYPGEALGGTVGRAVRHLGLPFRTLVEQVLLRPDANLSFFLPSGLQRLAELTRMPPHVLLAGHTPFAYWSAYVPELAARGMLAAFALQPEHPASKQRPLLKTGWLRCTRLRFCPQCRAANLAKYEESYWHRDHLLPTILDCPIHGCVLLEDGHPWSERRAFRLLPQDIERASVVQRPADDAIPAVLARVSWRALTPERERREHWSDLYRAQAQRLGYLNASGTLAAVQLTWDLGARYGPEFLASLGCSLGEVPERAWPVLLLRRSVHSRFSPVKHLLLECFFELSGGPGPNARRKTGPRPAPAPDLDADLVAAIQQRWDQAAGAGERLTVRAMLNSIGVWSVVRTRRGELPRTAALLRAFRRSKQWRPGGRRNRAAPRPTLP